MVVGLYDRTDAASQADISDYLVNHFQDAIARVDGVGSSQIFGSQYAMRVWLDPYRLATVKLMPSDVQSAIAAQNVEVSAGQIGADPAPEGQQRSEEHTSELQSLMRISYAVFCLKKKNKKHRNKAYN